MRRIDIYTDGSHLDKLNNGRLGCGGVMIDNGRKVDEFSEELKPEWLRKTIGTDKVSNPTAEMLGVLTALTKFDIPDDAEVYVYADYIGCKQWNTGQWKIKEPYIKKVKELIDKVIEEKNLQGRINFEWVKGHQGQKASIMDPHAKWNSVVDKLAKGIIE